MGNLDHFDQAVLGLAVLSSLLASGALILSLRNKPVISFQAPQTASASSATAADDSSKPKDEDSDDDETGEKKDSKDKENEKSDIIDDAYKLIHQRYNRKEYKWDDFDPLKDAQTHEGVIFIVYHRHYEPSAVRQLERLVEIHSENLKEVLRVCLKHIDAVFDPKPLVRFSLDGLTID